MTITDRTLSAYLDAELDPDEAAQTVRALAADPALRNRLFALKAADASATQVFEQVDQRPLPSVLVDMLAPETPVRNASASRTDKPNRLDRAIDRFRQWRRLHQPVPLAAMAASVALIIGLGVGLSLQPFGPGATTIAALEGTTGRIGQNHPLYPVLESTSSGQTRAVAEGAGIHARPMLSFRSRDGAFCRDLAVSRDSGTARLIACKAGGDPWRIVTLAAASPAATAGEAYVPATGEGPAIIESAIDALIAGEPLDSAEERRAMAAGWTD